MVAESPLPMEWELTDQGPGTGSDPLRCLPDRLGSSVQWDTDRWPMVSTREEDAHQLSGVAGSLLGSKDLPEGLPRDGCSVVDGQHNSCSLHQQPKGDGLT